MSKEKQVSAVKRSPLERIEYTPPMRMPHGAASLVLRGGRILAVAWEGNVRLLLAGIREGFPGARPADGRKATFRNILERYATGKFPAAREILSQPFAWERVSEFDRKVLEATSRVPAGSTATYGDVAWKAGRPGAARAAGGALGRNPWPIVIPCHRIVGASGDLTGFGKGLPAKRALLAFESALPVRPGGAQ